jgi:Domain of unknown function (DUF4384)
MSARCPSDLALERHLLEPEASSLAGHLAACPACAARLAAMQQQDEDFASFVYPVTVEAVEATAGSRWTAILAWRRWLVLVPALGAAAAVFLMARPTAPPDDYLGVKGGGPLGLAVFVQEGTGARQAHDGEVVAAGAALRFRIRTAQPCHLWILSVDARGQISRLFPLQGEGGAVVERSADLPGGAVLDGQPGPERILALCTPAPVAWPGAEAAVRAVFTPAGPEAVRRGATVTGLAPGAAQDSVLLEKRP